MASSPPPLTRRAFAAGMLAAPGQILPHDTPPLQVSQLIALTGADALTGDAFRNGVEMAVQEINAAGGLLGRLVKLSTFNTRSSPEGAREAAVRALEGSPLALLGPVATAETLAVAPMARARQVMQVTAAESAGLPAAGEPMLLMAGPGRAARTAILARWVRDDLAARRVAVLSADGGGAQTGWQFATACRALGLEVVADLVVQAGAAPGAARNGAVAEIARAAASGAQALFVMAEGETAAHIVRVARQQAPGLVLFGGAALLAPAVRQAAGEAAAGLRAHVALAADAPVPSLEAFSARYGALYHQPPDAVAMQGHIALWMVWTAVRRLGHPAAPLLARALRAAPVRVAEAPGVLLDTSWTQAGAADRASFMAEVLPGGGLSWSVLPPLGMP